MKENSWLVYISIGLTIVVAGAGARMYWGMNINSGFWYDSALAVLGGGVLAIITSFVTYYSLKKKTLHSFNYQTRALLKYLNQYDIENMTLDEKVDFFWGFYQLDKIEWDLLYEEIYFLWDFRNKKKDYIRDKIYLPIVKIDEQLHNDETHYRVYKRAKMKNQNVISECIKKVEDLFMVQSESYYDGTKMKFNKNNLVKDVQNELKKVIGE